MAFVLGVKVLRATALGGLGLLAALATSCAREAPTVSQGRALYHANGCSSCHGPDGHGDGPLAPKLPASPIDFRNVSLFKRGTTENAIAETLAEGVSMEHTIPALHYTHHELLMPKFDHLTKTERRSIALYVISLRTNEDRGSVQR
jgi:mono/diheme cytochrome c family protein